ncbi:MAG: TonB-dependent receptor plug domain-containing protein [Ignavibacteria bacterium]|jgi:iron complex outermembrane receptor protein|nr:TonB-dependent receptor plug domain-containing protein [Ignavibacteria bacterium]
MFNKLLFNAILIFFASFFLLKGQNASVSDELADSAKVYQAPSITVTTTRAIEGISGVPFSEMSKIELSNFYTVQDVPKLLSWMPSITSYSQNGNDIGYSNLTMRGFDQIRISVLINGIPQNGPEDHQVFWIDFPDISSNVELIQVQRGAGLTNYGSASIGGSINMLTSNFVNTKGVKLFSGIGVQQFADDDDNAIFQNRVSKFSLEISSGIVDDFAFYGRLSRINSLGYRDRSWTEMNSFFLSAIKFSKNLTTQINVFGGPIKDALVYAGVPKSYIKDKKLRRKNPSDWQYDATGTNISYFTERREQELEGFTQPHYEILNDWKISENALLKSALFYYTGDGYYDYDASWADSTTLRITSEQGFNLSENPTNALIKANVSNKQIGWIPRMIFKHSGGELTFGTEIRFHRSNHWGKVAYADKLPENYNPDYKIYELNGIRDIFSVFARERYEFSKKLAMSFELQLVHNRYGIEKEKSGNFFTSYLNQDGETVSGSGEIFNVNHLFFNPKIGATYFFDNNISLYSLLAWTSHEPRMSSLYPASDAYSGATPLFEATIDEQGNKLFDFSKPLAKPEKMLNFELGGNYGRDNFTFGANFYWMQYFDELVKSGQLDILGEPIDGNAPKTLHYGLELDAACFLYKKVDSYLSLSANATFSRNRIIEYDFITNQGEAISLKDNEIAGFPSLMANIMFNYNLNDFFASIKGKYLGNSRTDNFGDLITKDSRIINHLKNDYMSGYYSDNVLDSYFVVNADFSYTFKNILDFQAIRLQLQINNLLNRIYAAGGEGKDFFPAAERNLFFGIELGI